MTSIEKEYYENESFWASDLFEEADRLRFDFVIANIGPDVRSLLDVGCGNGLFLERVKALRPDITTLHGVDRSAAALSHVSFPTTKASADLLPFSTQSFDCVTCLEVIEHLPIAVYDKAISQLVRISRNQLLISVPHEQDLKVGRVECPGCRTLFNPDYHLRSFSESSFSGLLESHGYSLRSAKAFGISREFKFVRQIDAMKRVRGNRFPVDLPCPVCGTILPAKTGRIQAHIVQAKDAPKGFREVIKTMWPKVNVPRWLLADYVRM